MAMNSQALRVCMRNILNFTQDLTALSENSLLDIKREVPATNFSDNNKHTIIARIDNEIMRRRIQENVAANEARQRIMAQLETSIVVIEDYLENPPLSSFLVYLRRFFLFLIFCGAIMGGAALLYQQPQYLIASAVLAIVSAFCTVGIEYINTLGMSFVRNIRENVLPVVNPQP